MRIEAILLTGGGSTRMGLDKASMVYEGSPLGVRTANALATVVEQVTVLGREPIEGFPFVADRERQAGPLSALSAFVPEADLIFVCSCDMPHFHPGIVEVLASALGDADAAVPQRAGIRQPTCALYRRSAFEAIGAVQEEGKQSLMGWLDRLQCVRLDEEALRRAGLDPVHFLSFNTPEEFARVEAEWARFNAETGPPSAPAE